MKAKQEAAIILTLVIMVGVLFLGTPKGRDIVYEAGNGIVDAITSFVVDLFAKDSDEPKDSEGSYGIIEIGDEQPENQEPGIDGFQ